MQELMGHRYACPYEMATLYTALGDKDQAFAWLQEAFRAHSICVIWLNNEPRFDPLRSDPRFTELLRQLNL